MKSTIQRALFAVAVAALGAGAVGTASAQTSSAPSSAPGARHGGHHRFHRFGGSPFLGTFLRAVNQLNKTPATALSGAQQTTLKSLLQSARQSHAAGAGQGTELSVIGNPSPANASAYAAAIQQAEANATSRISRDATLATQIYQALNLSTTQQSQLVTILNNMQAQQQAHRAQWAAKHPGNS
ncbi:MAG TPA: hypothetical protein VMF03_05470 [Steroidobacteraceae bacterium]|nr:hypothetical protein [Steroidobacteraceae bacterium]